MPSQSFTDREKELKDGQVNEAQANINDKTKVYFTLAKKFHIANFIKEIKVQGSIDRAEESLIGDSNLIVTEDKEKQDFIEASNPFKNGQIILCKSIAEAIAMRNARNAAKRSHKDVSSESITEVKG